jgi:endonuclease/exonuclease/phosphatase family metal-dependent hydrolase
MTRILSYNILAGGYNRKNQELRRTQQLVHVIRAARPDIVGMPEAIHPLVRAVPSVIEEVADQLGMQLILGKDPNIRRDYQVALMTRLPVLYTKVHARPGVLARPLLEVGVREESGQELVVFVTHLSAAFNRGRAGGSIRMREIQEILRIMSVVRAEGKPHVLMGDFNSLAPGDSFKAHLLLRYILRLDTADVKISGTDGHPGLANVVPPVFLFFVPLLVTIARSSVLSGIFNALASEYAPRGCIREIKETYIDSFRRLHPQDAGFTCPSGMPAGRIDYIFASPEFAERLEECRVLTEGEGMQAYEASDHLPVLAQFQ